MGVIVEGKLLSRSPTLDFVHSSVGAFANNGVFQVILHPDKVSVVVADKQNMWSVEGSDFLLKCSV